MRAVVRNVTNIQDSLYEVARGPFMQLAACDAACSLTKEIECRKRRKVVPTNVFCIALRKHKSNRKDRCNALILFQQFKSMFKSAAAARSNAIAPPRTLFLNTHITIAFKITAVANLLTIFRLTQVQIPDCESTPPTMFGKAKQRQAEHTSKARFRRQFGALHCRRLRRY